jgi:hypothetical protein
MDKKIVCAICKNEENRFCTVKKSSVAINKKRHCNKFVLEPTKVKEKQILKTIRLPYQDKEVLRQHYKKELKKYNQQTRDGQHNTTVANPTTGDLSRFMSTAGDKKNDG